MDSNPLWSLMKGREYLFFRNPGSAKLGFILLHFHKHSSGCWPLPKSDIINVFWSPRTSRFYVNTEKGKRRGSRVNSKLALLWHQRALSTHKVKNLLRFSILENIFSFFSEWMCVQTCIRKAIGVVRYWTVKESSLMQFANRRGKEVRICILMAADTGLSCSSQGRRYLWYFKSLWCSPVNLLCLSINSLV